MDRFTFHGFLPSKAGQRKTALEELVPGDVTHVFYEAPHRILDTLADVESVFGTSQYVVIARELTKLHEEFLRGGVGELRSQLAARSSVRGEIVLMLAPSPAEKAAEGMKLSLAAAVAGLMKSEGISEMDALKRVARDRGIGKSEAYRELQREQNRLR
jgi:16S rRNA (cytidine1402-2'-O)-methyltransferase